MPKVSFRNITWSRLTLYYVRCDAPSRNLDGKESHRRSHEKTDILVNTFNPRILWDDFGIRHNIVVCIVYTFYGYLLAKMFGSHSHIRFHVQTSMSSLHLIFSIN